MTYSLFLTSDGHGPYPWHVRKDGDVFAKYATREEAEECVENHLKMEKFAIENDPVNHPKHYTTHPSGVECITVTEHMNFNKGNAVKYIWRAGDKGDEIQDLEKARWYIDREIARLKAMK